MSTAPLAGLARVHHALGDLTRLRIAHRLLLGDAAPGELGEWLGLPSNLVAHHLTTLTAAGIARRLQSEGDRRRHYVSLVADPVVEQIVAAGAPTGLAPRAPRIAFVCTANSARSQMAAACWNDTSPIPAISAGTRPAARVHPRAVAIADRHGLALEPGGTHDMAATVRPDDLVIAVCDRVHEELPQNVTRLHWAVADPAPINTDAAFERAFADLSTRLVRLRRRITDRAEPQKGPA